MKADYIILQEIVTKYSAYIQIGTCLGEFDGATRADEIDEKYPSQYQAYEIAFAKALRKFSEAAIRVIKEELKTLNSLLKEIQNKVQVHYGDPVIKSLLGKIKAKKKELTLWESRRDNLSKNIVNRVQTRDAIVAKYEQNAKEDKKD